MDFTFQFKFRVALQEGFHTKLGGSAGTPIVCTIDEFVSVYDGWTTFEGAVVFGTKAYADFCKKYPAALVVEATEDTVLYSMPATTDMMDQENRICRTVLANERLKVCGLYRNTLGEDFYQVDNDGEKAYIKAQSTKPLFLHMDTVFGKDLVVPEKLQLGQNLTLGGEVFIQEGSLTGLTLRVTDSQGQVVQEHKISGYGNMIPVPADEVDFSKLKEDAYTFEILAGVKSYYVAEDGYQTMEETATVYSGAFTVGNGQIQDQEENGGSLVFNGWIHDQNTWFYYKDGVAQVGWICYNGVDYYLQEDGSVTVGWKNINGFDRYFSNTGAMRTGWLETAEGTYFMLSNGVAARGLRTIDNKTYYFQSSGLMQREGQILVDGVTYIIQADGQAIAQ